jgi:hypothetical protein
MSHSFMAAGGRVPHFEVSPGNLPDNYQSWAAAAFMGLPVFGHTIVRHPKQWSYRERGSRRVVIKEINPFACDWLMETYRPRLIYLVRHPAAVALSNKRLGFVADTEPWNKKGNRQARAHRFVLDCLAKWQDYRIVQYEALCANPVPIFRELFDFAQMDWNDAMADYIVRNSSEGDRSKPYDLSRNSHAMIDAWRADVSPMDLSALHDGFQAYDLPWYQSPEDWQLDGVQP